ncbi:MAG: AsmA-like C-terminal region-containing protein [Gammaproteobacteria bacterium]
MLARSPFSGDTAATLADLGFRPELSAIKGSLSGTITWQPLDAQPWLETATGQVSMRFDDGVARDVDNSRARGVDDLAERAASGVELRPFPLLTVPALLSGIARPPANSAVPVGELRFKRLDAEFELRNGQAHTSDLHFDGDAEILVRGRAGLLARDYDYEAWVLRGEERIPASLRRLAATPRVAAAWMTLRDLIRGDAAERSRVVLHLRGSWNEPVVTVE